MEISRGLLRFIDRHLNSASYDFRQRRVILKHHFPNNDAFVESLISISMTPLTSVRTLRLSRSFCRFLSTDVGEALTKEEYNEQFKEYQRKLYAFRVEAKEELEGRRRERERREKERKRSSAALEEERQVAREAALKERQLAHHQHQKEAKEAKRQRQALSFKREALRREMLSKAEDERYQKMLEESRTWITMETLTERIERALDHPTTLY